MQTSINIFQLENGLTVIVERIDHLRSVSYDLLIPGGVLTDEDGQVGASLMLGELCTRGAGPYSSRELSETFEQRGIRHGEGGGLTRFVFRGSSLAEQLPSALELVSHMVLRPSLPSVEIEPIRDLLLQDIHSLEDHPAQKVMVKLAENHYPSPYNRCSHGFAKDIESLNVDTIRNHWKSSFAPQGSILSVAGQVNPEDVLALAKKFFADWQGKAVELPEFGKTKSQGYFHESKDSAQTQIGVAFPSAKMGDPLYYTARVVSSILSGGMHGRLFVEVREKRGLCYSVHSRHSGTDRYGMVTAYAGTTPDRAKETLDVMLLELERVAGTVTPEELERAKANILASVIMSEESAAARAVSNAGDYSMLRRVRSLEEIQAAIEAVSLSDIDAYVGLYPARVGSIQTLGPAALRALSQG